MSLFVTVPPALASYAESLGFARATADDPAPPLVLPDPKAVLGHWARGNRMAVCAPTSPEELWQLRPLALFCASFGEPLVRGSFETNVRAYGGLVATQWRTPQHGSLLFVSNPNDHPVTGGVFPAFEERTLSPNETLVFARDFPLGRAETYLGAYAGLVKSEAFALTAHIRPDPFAGARVFVVGEPGAVAEVSLFNAGPGEPVTVAFAPTPAVFPAGISQVIAVPQALAAQVWIEPEETWIGPGWVVDPAGALHAVSPVAQTTLLAESEPQSARLIFVGQAPRQVWANGVPLRDETLVLLPGENTLTVSGAFDELYLIPDGSCYQVALTRWEPQSCQ